MSGAQTEEFYQSKIQKFKSLNNAGVGLIIGSVPVSILGIVLMTNADKRFDSEEDDLEGGIGDFFDYSGQTIIGFILVDLACTALIGGTTMVIIGGIKMKKYRAELEHLKLGTYITPKHAGFTLTYRF